MVCEWITVVEAEGSSWVKLFGLVEYGSEIRLAVEFLDGVVVAYKNTGWDDFASMKSVASRGKWLWGNMTTRRKGKKQIMPNKGHSLVRHGDGTGLGGRGSNYDIITIKDTGDVRPPKKPRKPIISTIKADTPVGYAKPKPNADLKAAMKMLAALRKRS